MATEQPHIRHSKRFDQILDRIAACEDWAALGAVVEGVDEHWGELGLTIREVELIGQNARYRASKIPEDANAAHTEYADEQMAIRAARKGAKAA
mgnify:CR=1 FL=1